MKGFVIKKVIAREILDSRGEPTVEADVVLDNGIVGTASVPSGISKGVNEAVELRDKGKRYNGKGVLKAVVNVNNKISRAISGFDCRLQKELDLAMASMDATADKSRLGANAILAVSLANARAAARAKNVELYEHLRALVDVKKKPKLSIPVPFCNVIEGGKHASNNLKIQEFMIAPVKAKSFREAAQMAAETYEALKLQLLGLYGKSAVNVGYEGGFAPPISDAREALRIIEKAVHKSGHSGKIRLAIDAAASEFYKKEHYMLDKRYSEDELLDYYLQLIKDYKLISIEDPFEQEDFKGFNRLTKLSGIQIVADDLTTTNMRRVLRAVDLNAGNCMLLKPNQAGTLTEAIEAGLFAMSNKWKVMVSHRGGETDDSFISDLAVALGCGQVKIGAPARGERVAKYNRLLRIEEEAGRKIRYARL